MSKSFAPMIWPARNLDKARALFAAYGKRCAGALAAPSAKKERPPGAGGLEDNSGKDRPMIRTMRL
jgi:hypothetical protein